MYLGGAMVTRGALASGFPCLSVTINVKGGYCWTVGCHRCWITKRGGESVIDILDPF
jgi:hypothetical protein